MSMCRAARLRACPDRTGPADSVPMCSACLTGEGSTNCHIDRARMTNPTPVQRARCEPETAGVSEMASAISSGRTNVRNGPESGDAHQIHEPSGRVTFRPRSLPWLA